LATASRTLSRVFASTRSERLIVRETVAVDTPARRATSFALGRAAGRDAAADAAARGRDGRLRGPAPERRAAEDLDCAIVSVEHAGVRRKRCIGLRAARR
jgi:hypothetical protein